MKVRSVVLNPMPGDALSFNGWRITVTERQGDVVMCVGDKDDKTRRPTYTLAEWGEWSKDAKVLSRPLEPHECQKTRRAAGPCSVDGVIIQGEAHLWLDGLFCEEHCGATKHWPGKA